MNAEAKNLTLTCDGCGARADLPRVGRESEFYSLQPANGWELYPGCLCPECKTRCPVCKGKKSLAMEGFSVCCNYCKGTGSTHNTEVR